MVLAQDFLRTANSSDQWEEVIGKPLTCNTVTQLEVTGICDPENISSMTPFTLNFS